MKILQGVLLDRFFFKQSRMLPIFTTPYPSTSSVDGQHCLIPLFMLASLIHVFCQCSSSQTWGWIALTKMNFPNKNNRWVLWSHISHNWSSLTLIIIALLLLGSASIQYTKMEILDINFNKRLESSAPHKAPSFCLKTLTKNCEIQENPSLVVKSIL